MKLLLDECVTRYFKPELIGHEVSTIEEAGFKGLKNGALLNAAVLAGFEVLITVDRNMEHQQRRVSLPLAILVLVAKSNSIKDLRPIAPNALKILATIQKGDVRRAGA